MDAVRTVLARRADQRSLVDLVGDDLHRRREHVEQSGEISGGARMTVFFLDGVASEGLESFCHGVLFRSGGRVRVGPGLRAAVDSGVLAVLEQAASVHVLLVDGDEIVLRQWPLQLDQPLGLSQATTLYRIPDASCVGK